MLRYTCFIGTRFLELTLPRELRREKNAKYSNPPIYTTLVLYEFDLYEYIYCYQKFDLYECHPIYTNFRNKFSDFSQPPKLEKTRF